MKHFTATVAASCQSRDIGCDPPKPAEDDVDPFETDWFAGTSSVLLMLVIFAPEHSRESVGRLRVDDCKLEIVELGAVVVEPNR